MSLVLLAHTGLAHAQAGRIFSVAGSGVRAVSGDGGPATDAGGEFFAVAALPGGGFLLGESGVVRRVDAHGIITTVAGIGLDSPLAPLGDGGPATSARLIPTGLAALPGGGFLVADPGDYRIRRVWSNGTIKTVAGGGSSPGAVPGAPAPPIPPAASGDGGSAISAVLADPVAVAVLPGGGFLIAEETANRVRRVDSRGIITTVAGTGAAGHGGDGGLATRASVEFPDALAVLPGGGFLLAERLGGRIRRVDSHGTITTVAGHGVAGSERCLSRRGDGGPATSARIANPSRLAVLPDGGFLIAEAERVRKVDSAGRISTLAGGPQCAPLGHRETAYFNTASQPWSGLSDGLGGPAGTALIDASSLAVRADGSVLLAGGEHALMLPAGPHPSLAVALRPPTLVGRSIRLQLATTRPGRARVLVRSAPSGRPVVHESRRLPAGLSAIGLPQLPAGTYVVRVTLTGASQIATDETTIVSGAVLSTSLARAAIATRCCEASPAVQIAARALAAEQEAEETPPSIVSCRRFGAARVDCATGWGGSCTEAFSATLHNALVYLQNYRCLGPPRLRARPAYGYKLIAALQ